jgi:hypothetical protein
LGLAPGRAAGPPNLKEPQTPYRVVSGQLFLIAEFAAGDMLLAGFTALNPGSTVDLISEPVIFETSDRVHPSVLLAKGADPEALDGLLAQLRAAYGRVETLERNDDRKVWLGRLRIRESMIRNTGALVLARFQKRYGVPWVHLEAGLLHMRARIADPDQAEVLADQVRRFLDGAGVEAQVEVREMAAKDYGVWDDLVQRSIGLGPAPVAGKDLAAER